MALIKEYADLIKSLPVGGQFIKIKRGSAFWKRPDFSKDVKKVVKTVFKECSGDEKYINISRDDIRNDIISRDDIKKTIVKILMWGYPRGGGQYGPVKKILRNLNDLTIWLEENKGNNFDSVKDKALDNLSKIKGLGPSTISKLLYFFDVKIGNIPCQIYDEKVIESLNKNHQIDELSSRNNWDRNDEEDYEEYINLLFRLSKKCKCSPDQIELFLFMINNSFNLG